MWSIGGSALGGGPSFWAEVVVRLAKKRETTTPARSHMFASIAELEIWLDYSADARISSAPQSIRGSRPAVAVPEAGEHLISTRW
jgi:hypothetical protein